MHELSITRHILDIAVQHAQAANATRITRISLVIGQLSSFIDDSIQFYWDIIAEGTLAEGAELAFKRQPARMKCHTCATQFDLNEDFRCPACESPHVTVISGDELFVESIDIETAVNHKGA